jgi:hypothetical protein
MDLLMQALQYTSDDLKANQQGRVGPFQAVRLRRTLVRSLTIGGVVLIFGILGAAAALTAGSLNASQGLTLLGIALTVFNAAVVGFLAQFWLRTRTDLTRPVLRQQGLVHRTIRATKSGRLIGFVVRLEGVSGELHVNKAVFNAFRDNTSYRFYRAAGSRTLLSAEEVTGKG